MKQNTKKLDKQNKINKSIWIPFETIKYIAFPIFFIILLATNSNATMLSFSILGQLNYIKIILDQTGPVLSAILFIIAGIFYAIGQLLPPDKKANFHTAAINIIIGAIVVAVLSVASTSFATASTHLLSNFTTNSISNVT